MLLFLGLVEKLEHVPLAGTDLYLVLGGLLSVHRQHLWMT